MRKGRGAPKPLTWDEITLRLVRHIRRMHRIGPGSTAGRREIRRWRKELNSLEEVLGPSSRLAEDGHDC
jgi:hypothetical protein